MNSYQMEFSDYWDQVANTAFYQVVQITERSGFRDKLLDNQRRELSLCIKKQINRTFFDTQNRPKGTVWMENLRKDNPDVANRFEQFIINCELSSKGYENILTIAAGGTVALTGAVIAKKHAVSSVLLLLSGMALAGCKIASSIRVDTNRLQKEVKNQFAAWKTSLLDILEHCSDASSDQGEHEQT